MEIDRREQLLKPGAVCLDLGAAPGAWSQYAARRVGRRGRVIATDILAMMREANFHTVFCGIETPEPEALKAISKTHNMMTPMLESVETLNNYGMEVVSGIILGLDTDRPDTADRLLAFIEESRIPMLTVKLSV